jgi:hypothetical protein
MPFFMDLQSKDIRGNQTRTWNAFNSCIRNDGMIDRQSDADIERESKPEGHGNVQSGIGLGRGHAHRRRNSNIGSARSQYCEQNAVAGIFHRPTAEPGNGTTIDGRNEDGKGRQEEAIIQERFETPGSHHAHFQQKNGEKTFEDIRGERLDAFSLLGVGYDAYPRL